MYTHRKMHGFATSRVVNWVLMMALVAVLISILCPVRIITRESPNQTNCTSQIRQLAVAALMYCQDNNGAFPDMNWARELSDSIGNHEHDFNSKVLFHCPNDKSSDKNISYGYSGLLIRADGKGVQESDIAWPTSVGLICDAGPSRRFPNGGLVGGGGLLPASTMAVTPIPRHSGGTIVGYADGHASYIPNGYNPKDTSSALTQAFFMAGALGCVANPAGGISAFPVGATSPEKVTVGGEPCMRALLCAAADVWQVVAKAPLEQDRFKGQYAVQQRGGNYLWGIGDGKPPAGCSLPIARDLVVVIIAKNSQIPLDFFHQQTQYGVPVWEMAMVRKAFTIGYSDNCIQAYTFDKDSGTRRFFTTAMGMHGKPLPFGAKTITVKDDYEMVQRIGADPWGIGYCSSAIADLNAVQVIGLRSPDGKVHLYPQDDPKSRWLMPAAPPDWPLTRTLYAECGGNAWRAGPAGIANVMLAPGAPGTLALQAGPLYRASFWTP